MKTGGKPKKQKKQRKLTITKNKKKVDAQNIEKISQKIQFLYVDRKKRKIR